MNAFHDAAYNMAAVSATVALYRALIKKGVLAREEAVVHVQPEFALPKAATRAKFSSKSGPARHQAAIANKEVKFVDGRQSMRSGVLEQPRLLSEFRGRSRMP